MMGWPWYDLTWWGMGLGMLIMLLIGAGIIALIVWVIIRVVRSANKSSSETPLDIAKTRYARGEITKKEYEQIKKDLS